VETRRSDCRGVLLLGAAWDLFWPAVPRSARLPAGMSWGARNGHVALVLGHANVRLFRELAQLLRQQYHLPLLRSYVTATTLPRAASVFQGGHNRDD